MYFGKKGKAMVSKKLALITNIISMIGAVAAVVFYQLTDYIAVFNTIIIVVVLIAIEMDKAYNNDPANKYSEYALKQIEKEHHRQIDILNDYKELIDDLRYQELIRQPVHDMLISKGQEYLNKAYAGGRLFARENAENNELSLFEILLGEIERLYSESESDSEFRTSLRNTHTYITTFLSQHGIHINSCVDMYAESEADKSAAELITEENQAEVCAES